MSVIQLEGHFVGELVKVVVRLFVSPDNVLCSISRASQPPRTVKQIPQQHTIPPLSVANDSNSSHWQPLMQGSFENVEPL